MSENLYDLFQHAEQRQNWPLARDTFKKAMGLLERAIDAEVLAEANGHRLMVELGICRDLLTRLDKLREGCSPDELGAVAGNAIRAFVTGYQAYLARREPA